MFLIPSIVSLFREREENKATVNLSRAPAITAALCALLFAVPMAHGATDADLRRAVRTELRISDAVDARYIDIAVRYGTVELTGQVDHLLACERAAEIARSVAGVRSVVNRLDILAPSVTDSDILRAVSAALARDPALARDEVAPTVAAGVVTLTGSVDSRAERRIAGRAAREVRGVQEVIDRLAVNAPVRRSDAEIRADVRERLDWDLWVDAGLLRVAVADGKVTLTGAVGSAAERSRAYALAMVAGVSDVDASGLSVNPVLRDDMRKGPAYAPRDPEAVRNAVRAALRNDPRVFADDVTVEYENGRVTLTGAAASLRAKISAARDAGNTAGVRRVQNLLKVRPAERRTDSEIAGEVREWLSWDPYVTTDGIAASVENGEVFLRGTVRTRFEKERAGELAGRVRGAVAVSNRLRAQRPPVEQRSDAELRDAVLRKITWDPFVDVDQVGVTVQDGNVTLVGTVDDWRESHLAEKDAYEAGAKRVRNLLDFEYGAT